MKTKNGLICLCIYISGLAFACADIVYLRTESWGDITHYCAITTEKFSSVDDLKGAVRNRTDVLDNRREHNLDEEYYAHFFQENTNPNSIIAPSIHNSPGGITVFTGNFNSVLPRPGETKTLEEISTGVTQSFVLDNGTIGDVKDMGFLFEVTLKVFSEFILPDSISLRELTNYRDFLIGNIPMGQGNDIDPFAIIILNHTETEFSSPFVQIRTQSLDTDGDGTSDSDEIVDGRNPNNANDLGFYFDNPADLEQWSEARNINNLQANNGVLSGTATTNDPYIINRNVNVLSADIEKMFVRLKISTPTNRAVQLFYTTTDTPNFNANQRITALYTGRGDWQTVAFHLSDATQYDANDIITGLRFDAANLSGSTFEIDSIFTASEAIDTDGDGTNDFDEAVANRNPNDASDLGFDFVIPADFEQWSDTRNINNLQATNGVLSGVATTNDPYIINGNLNVLAADINQISVRVKISSSTNRAVQLFYKTGTSNFNASQRITSLYTGRGEWQTVTFDLSDATQYNANDIITGLRFDAANLPNATFEIDSISAAE